MTAPAPLVELYYAKQEELHALARILAALVRAAADNDNATRRG